MMIRNQDKTLLINLDNVASLNVNPSNKIIAMYPAVSEDCLYDVLGEYSSEENAIEVLDMIGRKCIGGFKMFYMPSDSDIERLCNLHREF